MQSGVCDGGRQDCGTGGRVSGVRRPTAGGHPPVRGQHLPPLPDSGAAGRPRPAHQAEPRGLSIPAELPGAQHLRGADLQHLPAV